MDKRVTFRIPGAEVVVVKGPHPLMYRRGSIHVGDTLLEADAQHSIMMDTLASLLLPPALDVRGDIDWLDAVTTSYRARVVGEEYAEVESKLGGLSVLVSARPSYPPVARMSLLRRLYPCIFNRTLEDLELLDKLYLAAHADLGLDPSRPIEGFSKRGLRSMFSAVRRTTMPAYSTMHSAVAKLARLPDHVTGCTPYKLLEEPWRLLSLPEGTASPDCSPVDGIVGALVGPGYRCSSPNPIGSSLKCAGPQGTVVVKSYMRMYPKWIPAALAASPVYNYRLGPKERMEADYRYLRILRKVAVTPRIHHVCGDLYNAKMVRSYLPGRVLLDSRRPMDWRLAGEGLAGIHEYGYTLGDSNPGNLIITPQNTVGVIDAEQAREANLKGMAWDIIVLTVTSIFYGAPEDLALELLRSYRSVRGPEVLEEALRERNWIGLLSIPLLVQRARALIRRSMEGKAASA